MSFFANWLATRLSALLFSFGDRNDLGFTAMECLFQLGEPVNRNRRPDVAFVGRERWPVLEGLHDRAPALVDRAGGRPGLGHDGQVPNRGDDGLLADGDHVPRSFVGHSLECRRSLQIHFVKLLTDGAAKSIAADHYSAIIGVNKQDFANIKIIGSDRQSRGAIVANAPQPTTSRR